jgi:hypothetical protein
MGVIRLNQKILIFAVGFIVGFIAMHLMHTEKLFGLY